MSESTVEEAKAVYLRELRRSGGRKTIAAEKAGRTTQAVRSWRKRDVEFARAEQMVLDAAMVSRGDRSAALKARYLRALGRGVPRAEAATRARRSYKTVMGWREKDEDFAEEEARVLRELHGRSDPEGVVPKPEVIRRLKAKLGCSNRWIADTMGCTEHSVARALRRRD